MKIAFISLGVYFPDGGMERFNQRVIRVLEDLCKEDKVQSVTVLSLRDKARLPVLFSQQIQFLGYSRNRVKAFFGFLFTLVKQRPELVLFGHVLLSPMALFVKILLPRSKTLLFAHGVEIWERPSKMNRWITKIGFSKILAVSNFTANQAKVQYGLEPKSVSVIMNAIDVSEVHYENSPTDIVTGTHRLITVSRLSKGSLHKNIDKVILAMPEILRKFPDTHYYVVGGGDLLPELINLAQTNKVNNNVHFLGSVADEEKEMYYQNAEIFVLPSVGEGFGIVFLEAWKHKLPVIASNLGASPEIVNNGVDGLCVSPDPYTLATSICYLLENEPLRMKMGASGYRKLQENYLHEHFHSALVQALLL